jgi:hypothetical protein
MTQRAIGDDGGLSVWSCPMNKLLLLPLSLLLACMPALAVDTTDTTPAPASTAPDKLAAARTHIKAARWADALELVRVCAGPCEEQADLKRGIDRFKANGNKYVAEAR